MKVHTPPAVDSYFVYVPKRIPAINTINHDAAHPSRLMVPFVPVKDARLGPAPRPCSLQGVPLRASKLSWRSARRELGSRLARVPR